MKGITKVFVLAGASLTLLVVLNTGAQSDDGFKSVSVTNFPNVQRVAGEVSVAGTVNHSEMHRWRRVVVPTVKRSDIMDGAGAGSVKTGGFTSATISVNGQTSDAAFKPGVVGVVFLPDETSVKQAFSDGSVIEFPLEATVQVIPSKSGYFSSQPVRLPVAFPRYKLYIYNTASTGVQANVYLYLTN